MPAGWGRRVLAAVAAGAGGGAAGGFGVRLAMWVIRLLNPSHNGEVTHEAAVVGRWTLDGTMGLLVEGAFSGAAGGAVYLLLRRLLPGGTVVRGLLFGGLVLCGLGGTVLRADYEYVRYVRPTVSLSLFAAVFPLYGLAVAAIADAIAPAPRRNRGRRPVILAGRALLAVAAVAGAVVLLRDLRAASLL